MQEYYHTYGKSPLTPFRDYVLGGPAQASDSQGSDKVLKDRVPWTRRKNLGSAHGHSTHSTCESRQVKKGLTRCLLIALEADSGVGRACGIAHFLLCQRGGSDFANFCQSLPDLAFEARPCPLMVMLTSRLSQAYPRRFGETPRAGLVLPERSFPSCALLLGAP